MRGVWYTVEAVMVSTIVISFLIAVGPQYVSTIEPKNLAEKGYLILEGLDNQGYLRDYAVSMDANGLNSLIPIDNYNHTVQICNHGGTCVGHRPDSNTVWTANYFIAGQHVYQPFIIRLYFAPL